MSITFSFPIAVGHARADVAERARRNGTEQGLDQQEPQHCGGGALL